MASAQGQPILPPRHSRPREVNDGLNQRVYHPLAARLARLLAPTGISPNAVSVLGMLLIWGAAWAYTQWVWPFGWLIGFTLHLLWHVVDGADGDLARVTGRQSARGELVDGVCDYAGHVLLYVLLAAMGARWLGGWSWTLASFAGASHILQTNQAETQRRSYLFWVYGVPWIKHAHARGDHVFSNRDWFSLGFSWGARLYLMLAKGITPASDRIDRAIDAAGPERRRRISRLAKAVSQRSLFCSKLIGPNPRTIILGICMGLGSPIYYFVAEIMLLNLLLVASVIQHNIATRRLLAAIQ